MLQILFMSKPPKELHKILIGLLRHAKSQIICAIAIIRAFECFKQSD